MLWNLFSDIVCGMDLILFQITLQLYQPYLLRKLSLPQWFEVYRSHMLDRGLFLDSAFPWHLCLHVLGVVSVKESFKCVVVLLVALFMISAILLCLCLHLNFLKNDSMIIKELNPILGGGISLNTYVNFRRTDTPLFRPLTCQCNSLHFLPTLCVNV